MNVYNTPPSSLEAQTAAAAVSASPMGKGSIIVGPPIAPSRVATAAGNEPPPLAAIPAQQAEHPAAPAPEQTKRKAGRPPGAKNIIRNTDIDPTPAEVAREKVIEAAKFIPPLPQQADVMAEVTSAPHNSARLRAEWEGRDLFVGFPCYKSTNPVTAWCLLAIALDLGRDKVRFDMELGDAMIYHARNRLAEKFLATEANWMLMIDDDIIPPIGRPEFTRTVCRLPATIQEVALQRHVVHRLMGHGKTLVGGAYFGRQQGGHLMASCVEHAQAAKIASDLVVPCDWVGTGCFLVHRKVFTAIKEKFPELAPAKPGDPFDYFRPMGNGIGEDISFCYRARTAGHQPHIDLGLQCFHVGYQCYYGQ